jgi:hypothetical protein
MSALGRVGGTYAALYAAHSVADHWIQTHHQAITKGQLDRDGQLACAKHVATLTATQAITLGLTVAATGERLNPRRVALGLAVNGLSHYWADRRYTLKALAEKVGKGEFAAFGDPVAAPCGSGAYALDQSWHHAWLLIAALIASSGAPE